MERKIGEIFEYNGEWYQCVERLSWGVHCNGCEFIGRICSKLNPKCSPAHNRSDGKSVIFKKLEKAGEPIQGFQRYKLAVNEVTYNGKDRKVMVSVPSKTLVYIELKQNKEDMEEKNKVKISRGNADYLISKLQDILVDHLHGGESDEVIAEFEKFIDTDEKHPNSEKIGKNLKPFNLEAAKAGKPVCTRNGRKARIICFDRIDNTGCNLPIVALVCQAKGTEVLQLYHNDGKCDVKADLDLMMLPEKKEGWVNVVKEPLSNDDRVVLGYIFNSYEDAVRSGKANERYAATIKIEWEE